MEVRNINQELSDAAIRLNAIFESATDGIITIDERGIMEMANKAAAHLFGYEAGEMIGRNVSMLMPEPHAGLHGTYMDNYYRSGQRKIIGIGREVEGRRKDGSVFPCRLSISEVNLQKRRVFTGIVHDLTDQKKAEKALREEKEKAQMYFELANNLTVVMDDQGRILELNQKGCLFLGVEEEEAVLNRDAFDLFTAREDRTAAREFFNSLLDGSRENIPEVIELHAVNHRGERRLIAWRSAVATNEQGKAHTIIASGVDITEQRAAEENIRQLNAELEKRVDMRTEELAAAVNKLLGIKRNLEHEIRERKAAEAALRKSEMETRKALEKEKELSELKSRFVSMASHEFRTPLSTILSSADLIEAYTDAEHQEKRKKHTERIKSAVSNLTSILNDFLSLSKLEEGHLQANPSEFNLRSFCQNVLDDLHGLLKPGQFIRAQKPDPDTWVFLDKNFLKNIFNNLLSNATKYSEPGKPIDCAVEISDQQLRISIRDYGIGIPEEEQQHLFTRFFRAHNVENIQGTGLGLNIVKRYVELMRGNVTFESRLGEGTVFRVSIPLEAPPEDNIIAIE